MNASETENSAEPANDVLPICTNCKVQVLILNILDDNKLNPPFKDYSDFVVQPAQYYRLYWKWPNH